LQVSAELTGVVVAATSTPVLLPEKSQVFAAIRLPMVV
jgi:hypothetical protein